MCRATTVVRKREQWEIWRDASKHPTVVVEHEGEKITLDKEIAPLIQWIWSKGWETCYCCQGNPGPGFSNWGYISFTNDEDLFAFLRTAHLVCDILLDQKLGHWSVRIANRDLKKLTRWCLREERPPRDYPLTPEGARERDREFSETMQELEMVDEDRIRSR